MRPRKAITRFAKHMEAALKENDHKGRRGWKGWSSEALFKRLVEEVFELHETILENSVGSTQDIEDVQKECADVANFAMMISDNLEEDDA